jgi:tripeptide aminopeptidase
MRAQDRFFRYIQFETASDEKSATCPSTASQLVLGRALVSEMLELGIADARIDDFGYVYGSIPSNAPGAPSIGLIAHMDTVDAVPCGPMHARLVRYEGGDIPLDEAAGIFMRAADYPDLEPHIGHNLIVTDGHTLLGGDDKAGVAEILTLCERLLKDPSIPHGKVCIGFTPDEEIGSGADHFDVAGFGADFAYTVDGGALAEIEYENFNAASATVTVNGLSIHPGSAKNKMKNALLMGIEFNQMLPPAQTPAHTENYEGFFHLNSFSGSEEQAVLHYIVRDHDKTLFEKRKNTLERIASFLNETYGAGSFVLELKDSYYNMKEKILPHMHIVDRAMNAMRASGYEPKAVPIRGGTDGARLSFMGLPCPNLSTGGLHAHGRFECVDADEMEAIVDILEKIVRA